MIQGILGNAQQVDPEKVQADVGPLLVKGETIHSAFVIVRDLFVFTGKRLILVDKQGVTGKKVEYHSIPYKSISHFSVETAGHFDLDAEMKIFLTGSSIPIQKEFKKGTDILAIQNILAWYVLQS